MHGLSLRSALRYRTTVVGALPLPRNSGAERSQFLHPANRHYSLALRLPFVTESGITVVISSQATLGIPELNPRQLHICEIVFLAATAFCLSWLYTVFNSLSAF